MKYFTTLLLLIAILLGCSRDVDSWPNTKFDSVEWHASREESRYVFVRDLIDRRLLIGKSEAAVRELLGPPTTVDRTGRQLSYVVREGGTGFDQVYSLDVILDSPAGVVQEVGIRGD
jgi:hypothetical protein